MWNLLKRHQSYYMMNRDENEQTSKYKKKFFNAKNFFSLWVPFSLQYKPQFFFAFPLKFHLVNSFSSQTKVIREFVKHRLG